MHGGWLWSGIRLSLLPPYLPPSPLVPSHLCPWVGVASPSGRSAAAPGDLPSLSLLVPPHPPHPPLPRPLSPLGRGRRSITYVNCSSSRPDCSYREDTPSYSSCSGLYKNLRVASTESVAKGENTSAQSVPSQNNLWVAIINTHLAAEVGLQLYHHACAFERASPHTLMSRHPTPALAPAPALTSPRPRSSQPSSGSGHGRRAARRRPLPHPGRRQNSRRSRPGP